MASSMQIQAALDDVSNRLEKLKATLKVDGLASDEGAALVSDSRPLLAIQQAAADLECLLRSAPALQGGADSESAAGEAAKVAHLEEPQQAAAPQKLVNVPVRKRSSRTASGLQAPPQQAAASSGYRQVSLPATPPTTADDVQPTPAEKGPRPSPADLPATTPLAIEVLKALGLSELANVAADAAERATPPARQLSGSSVAGRGSGSGGDLGASMLAAAGVGPQQTEQQPAVEVQVHLPRAASTAAAAAAAAAVSFAAAGPVSRPKAAPASQEPRKGCNCKRSMCLKMYCECFAAGGYCAPGCACANCYNHAAEEAVVQQARQIVLSKDPRAFEKKVTAAEGHKRGCRCKRSKCLKKYCECFNGGAKCNPDICQCEGCKNGDDTAAAAADAFISSVSPDSLESLAAPAPAMLRALAGIVPLAPQQAQQDTPQTSSMLDHADSSADSHGLAAAQQPAARPARGAGGRGGARAAQRQPAAAAPAAPRLAFAGFPPGLAAAPVIMGPGGAMMPAGMFPTMAMPPFLFNHMAAAASASLAAAGAGQPQLPAMQPVLLPIAPLHAAAAAAEGETASHGDAASLLAGDQPKEVEAPQPAPAAQQQQQQQHVAAWGAAGAAGVTASTPGPLAKPAAAGQGGSVALTAHLSEVLGVVDPDIRDTATSPALHVAVSRLPSAKAAAAGTLTARRPAQVAASGGSEGERSGGSTWASENGGGGSGGATGSMVSSGAAGDASQRSRRPKRAASGGVMGAVAAEAAAWGEELISPPKRASSVPPGGVSNRAKAAGRFALLKKALEAETMHAQKRARANPLAPRDCNVASMAADEEDVISALFELSSSMC